MIPIAVDERPYVLGKNTASVKLTFRAVSPSEAESLRPNVKNTAASPTAHEVDVVQRAPDAYADLRKLDQLRKDGILTEEEFQREKRKILSP